VEIIVAVVIINRSLKNAVFDSHADFYLQATAEIRFRVEALIEVGLEERKDFTPSFFGCLPDSPTCPPYL
jgi:hypothetical protein